MLGGKEDILVNSGFSFSGDVCLVGDGDGDGDGGGVIVFIRKKKGLFK